MDNIWILAQAESNEAPKHITSGQVTSQDSVATTKQSDSDPNTGTAGTERSKGFGNTQWIFLGLMFVIMYLLIFRGPRKKQQQHKQMVQTLSKNDKVRTIGGIIGTVVDVKGDEITLKIDESNNTKIKIASSAIGRNLSKDNS